jgi:hypothetical protein
MTKLVAILAMAQLVTAAQAGAPVSVGASVTLYATADGSPAPTFQWRKNGAPISGATGPTYVIASVSLADAGAYSVVASNNLGSATSPDETLVVQAAVVVPTNTVPVISTQPAATQTVASGGSATFTVVATGSPAPTYQWRKNDVDISGATSASLTLLAVTTSNAGTYSVLVSNLAGSVTSSNAVLTVTEPPGQGTGTGTGGGGTNTGGDGTSTVGGGSNTGGGGTSTVGGGTSTGGGGTSTGGGGTSTVGGGSNTGGGGTSTVGGGTSAVGGGTNTGGGGTSTGGGGTVTVVPGTGSGAPSGGTVTLIVSLDSAPVISVQPVASQAVAEKSNVRMSVVASGLGTLTYQWRKNGVNVTGATGATLSFGSVTATDSGTYNVRVSNAAGSVVSADSVLSVETSPVIVEQPAPQYVSEGAPARFSVSVAAVPSASYQWRKNGVNITGATGSTLSLPVVNPADVGTYSVVASNAVGSTSSAGATLGIAGPPIITRQPLSRAVYNRANVTFSVTAVGSPAPSYQWRKNGVNIAGATSATLQLKSVTRSDAGKYTVRVSNAIGWMISNTATLMTENVTSRREDEAVIDSDGVRVTPDAANASRLVNLSVRASAGSGDDGLIVGFVVDGLANKQVLIRGIGPSLRDFGVIGALDDPKLGLYSGSTLTASNDDWITNENALLIEGVSAGVGAFGLRERGADAALMTTLKSGAYTAQVSSKDASSGVALVEVYDTAVAASGSRLVNLSVRSKVGGAAEAPNVGFVIAGTTPKRVLIRAVGPTLRAFGVTDAIADPQLEVYRGPTLVEQNDNWGGGEVYSGIFSRVGAFGFADPESRDAVLFTVLDPGAYTVVVSGANGTSGVGLVELYEVP